MHILRNLVIGAASLYAAMLVLLYFLQSKLIFFPEHLSGDFAFLDQGKEVYIASSDQVRINALMFTGSRDKLILYFHGNAGSLKSWQHVAGDFVRQGYSVLMIDYRGYGKSTGSITETGFYEDAQAVYRYTLNQFTAENIIIYGRSIGTGVAVDLAARVKCAGVVLEAPYTSITDVAKEKLPWALPQLLLKTRFDNFKKLSTITRPIVFIHGTADSVIPYHNSLTLFNSYHGKKTLISIEGGEHNDLDNFPQYGQMIAGLDSFFSN